MATHLDHPIDFDKEFGRRHTRHEQHIKWAVLAFAVAVVVAFVMWATFLRYV